jgi:hypothetical protein
MMRRLCHPLAILGLALFFMFAPWLPRPGARLTITAAEPGREVDLRARWVRDGDTSPGLGRRSSGGARYPHALVE